MDESVNPPSPNSSKKILVVEDDPDLLEIASLKLSDAGYSVLKAKDGEEGLKVALSERPALILLDHNMPKMTGLEMLKELRTDEWGKKAQVFMLTSVNRSEEMSQGMHYNVAKYIIKSDINYDELIADIDQYLNNSIPTTG